MTPATATQNLNAKLRRATSGKQGQRAAIELKQPPSRPDSRPVSVVRRPGYRGGGYCISV